MKVTYHPRDNIAYIQLKPNVEEVETLHISDELNIDLVSDGTIYGIELLNANDQLFTGDNGDVLLINEETGESQEMSL